MKVTTIGPAFGKRYHFDVESDVEMELTIKKFSRAVLADLRTFGCFRTFSCSRSPISARTYHRDQSVVRGNSSIHTEVTGLIDQRAWAAALTSEQRNRGLLDCAAENWTKVDE